MASQPVSTSFYKMINVNKYDGTASIQFEKHGDVIKVRSNVINLNTIKENDDGSGMVNLADWWVVQKGLFHLCRY